MKKRWLIIITSVLLVVAVVIAAVFGLSQPRHHTTNVQRQTHPKDITVNRFIKQVAPAAQRGQKKYHILASITIAQAGTESNWGRSKLAYKYNNLFGIKANSKHQRVRMYTTENVNGKNKQVKQYFQVYPSWAASIRAHTLLIVNGTADDHQRFRSVQRASSYQQAAVELQKHGYATDPNYANELIYAIKKFHLNKYDR